VNAVNQKDRRGYTALHYAVQVNHEDIVEKLIQKGAGEVLHLSSHKLSMAINLCMWFNLLK